MFSSLRTRCSANGYGYSVNGSVYCESQGGRVTMPISWEGAVEGGCLLLARAKSQPPPAESCTCTSTFIPSNLHLLQALSTDSHPDVCSIHSARGLTPPRPLLIDQCGYCSPTSASLPRPCPSHQRVVKWSLHQSCVHARSGIVNFSFL